MKISYPYIPDGKEILYAPLDNKYMTEAKKSSVELSTDQNHPTGSVVVKNDEIIGKAGNLAGYKNKKLIEAHSKGMCVRKVLKIKSGEKYWLCPGCATNDKHSEALAVKDALSQHESIEGADLYLWGHWWCCEPCWNKMMNAGIKNVYLLEGSEVYFDKNNKNNVISKR